MNCQDEYDTHGSLGSISKAVKYAEEISASPRAHRRLEKESQERKESARSFLLSSLILISATPVLAFPEDKQKEVKVILKEITARIRRLGEIAK